MAKHTMSEQGWIVEGYLDCVGEVESWKIDHDEANIVCQFEEELAAMISLNKAACALYRSSVGPQLMQHEHRWARGQSLFQAVFDNGNEANKLFARAVREAEQAGFVIHRKADFNKSRKDVLKLSKHFELHWPSAKKAMTGVRQALVDIKRGKYQGANEFLNEIQNRTH